MENATNIANSSPDFGVGRVLFECTNEAHFMLKVVGMRGLVDILKSVGGKVRIPSMFSLQGFKLLLGFKRSFICNLMR